MPRNPYLTRKREQAEAVRSTIEGLQTRAAEENRDLTDDELRSITEQSQTYKTLAEEIETLTDVEVRSQAVSELAAKVNSGDDTGDGGDKTRSGKGYTKDRDPGHYLKTGGRHSFFGDLYRSRMGHDDATSRLNEHYRALDSGAGAGIIPPKWMSEEYEEALRQGRAAANAVRRVPITDPAPMTLPRQTTTAAVEDQESENDEVHEESPGYGSTVSTVTPRATAGKQTISRQLLDSSNPSVDQIIFADLVGDYNDKVEGKVTAAILAAGPAALIADAGEDDPRVTSHINKVALRAQVAVRRNRKNRRASIYVMSVSRWGEVLNLTDANGRPLVPEQTIGQAVNVAGVGSVASDGVWRGLPIVATAAAEPDEVEEPLEDLFATLHAPDVILFESGISNFSFEQPKGPESIILAVWAYTATHVKYGGAGVQTVNVEAGSPST